MSDYVVETSAGGIIVGPDGKIVIANQHGKSWSLPKGRMEPGENEEDTVRREVYEETGITDLVIIERLGEYKRHRYGANGKPDLDVMKRMVLYLCTSSQKNLEPVDPENPEARWVSIEEAEKMLFHEKDQKFLRAQIPKIKALLQRSA